jgi:hypothetical protein
VFPCQGSFDPQPAKATLATEAFIRPATGLPLSFAREPTRG